MPEASWPRPAVSARRALIADIKADKVGWLQHGVAALAVSALGLGVAGSVVLTGAAQPTVTANDQRAVTTSTRGPPAPAATAPASRSTRPRSRAWSTSARKS